MKIIKVSSDNIDNFNKEIKTPNLIAFVKIYSDSCGHCKAMESDWTQLEKELKNEDLNGLLASISSDDIDSADCDTDNRGVPTLRVYEGGEMKMDYEGKRKTADMKLFFKNLLKPKQKGGRKHRKKRTRKNFLKKSSKKRKTRRRRGGLSKSGKQRSDAMIASGMRRGRNDSLKFSQDSIAILEGMTSNKKEEEEGLNLKDLKLLGGRRKKRKKRRKSRRRKSRRRKSRKKKGGKKTRRRKSCRRI
jgi:thiol-disulfide isomerase/thioredoxin